MDLFAFSSHTETQGMVLAEAMAAGTPVVAVDAAGVREVVEDGRNGRLLPRADEEQFASALSWMAQRSRDEQHEMAQQAHQTGEIFDIRHTAAKAVELYQTTIERTRYRRCRSEKQWLHAHRAHRKLRSEWRIVSNVAKAAGTLCLPMREPYDFTVLTSCCDE